MAFRLLLCHALWFGLTFSTGANPPDKPVSAAAFQANLKRGVVAAWAEFARIEMEYSSAWPGLLSNAKSDGAANNFDHVRLRVSGGEPLENTWRRLDGPVDDSLAAGMSVIIAFKGWVNGTTKDEVTNQIVDWWTQVARHYANRSHRLAFNVFIEISGIMCNNYKPKPKSCPVEDVGSNADALNPLYERIVAAVQAITPGRVVIMPPPGKLNRPSHLPNLKVPSKCGSYCMAEWHVAAAGPCAAASGCPSNGLQWHGTDGTQAEHKAIADVVSQATKWSRGAEGLPVWTGAFMPGPWNHPKRGNMSIAAQASFAQTYTAELEKNGVPWSVLTAGAFIDETSSSGKWLSENKPIRNALLSNKNAKLALVV